MTDDKTQNSVTAVYCWRSGLIEFGSVVPKGAIEIARGPTNDMREIAEVYARHSRTSDDLLVPGIPEAQDEDEALTAAEIFRRNLKFRLERRRVVA